MKRTSIFAAIALVMAMVVITTSCRSMPFTTSSRIIPVGFPPNNISDWISDDAPEWVRHTQEYLLNQGHRAVWATATLANPSRARTIAANRARTELANMLAMEVSGLIGDIGKSIDMDIEKVRETQKIVSDIITRQTLVGTFIYQESLIGNTSHMIVKLPRDRIAENLELARNAAVKQVQGDASTRVSPDDLTLIMDRVFGNFLIAKTTIS